MFKVIDVVNLLGHDVIPEYITSNPNFQSYLDIENAVAASYDNILPTILAVYQGYIELVSTMVTKNYNNVEYWSVNNEALSYLYGEVGNLLVASDGELTVPYELTNDEYKLFVVNMNKLFGSVTDSVVLMQQTAYSLQRLQIELVYMPMRTVIDDIAKTPTIKPMASLYPIGLSKESVLAHVSTQALREHITVDSNSHFTLMMSELDKSLFEIYLWFGLKYMRVLNASDTLEEFYAEHCDFVSSTCVPQDITYDALCGNRYIPYTDETRDIMIERFKEYLPK